jgi:hypothetical protein
LKPLISLALICVLAFAQAPPQASLVSSQHFTWNVSTSNGDTPLCSAWGPTGAGGPFNGGYIWCPINDGAMAGSGSRNVLLLKLTGYDPANIANTTITLANAMTDYGSASSHLSICSQTQSAKTGAVWSDGGKLYIQMQCQGTGPWFEHYGVWILVSPNGGTDLCNYAHYVAATNSCTIANWSATGDVPASVTSADIQWPPPGGSFDGTSKVGQMAIVQVAQDGATPPVLPSPLSNTFHYYFTIGQSSGTIHILSLYLHRYTGDPMLPANHTHYNAGTWDANFSNSTAITTPGMSGVGFVVSCMWAKDLYGGTGGFLLQRDNQPSSAYSQWMSRDLVNWTPLPAIIQNGVEIGTQFSTFLLATYQTVIAGTSFTVSMSQNNANANGGGSGACLPTNASWCYVMGFAKLLIQSPAPVVNHVLMGN